MVGAKDGHCLLIFNGHPLEKGVLIARMKKEEAPAYFEILPDEASISSSKLTPEKENEDAIMLISVCAAMCWVYLRETKVVCKSDGDQANFTAA